ncbi:hypothetical protein [Mongoliimonas terrestris]|uniref:hypothetical protein n=1 Tax=Mongoliimonas terrestris TaxID=1709001 RepID=UPI000AE80C3B|nr:hypothetical protein [Mongoliimonas terrestris]
MAKKATPIANQSPADSAEDLAKKNAEAAAEKAERATAAAEAEGRLPANSAVTNPAPAAEMDAASGAFMEPEIKAAVAAAADHPAVENNPRAGTSAVQNGIDFNDPNRREPTDPKFAGQGLDLSVYGDAAKQ